MTGIFQAFTGHHRYHGSKRVTTTAGNDKTPAPLPEILLKKHPKKKFKKFEMYQLSCLLIELCCSVD
jgi:hypothetical protein